MNDEPAGHGAQHRLRGLIPYLVASFIFVCIGVANPLFMVNWVPGVTLLFGVVWVVPEIWRRRR